MMSVLLIRVIKKERMSPALLKKQNKKRKRLQKITLRRQIALLVLKPIKMILCLKINLYKYKKKQIINKKTHLIVRKLLRAVKCKLHLKVSLKPPRTLPTPPKVVPMPSLPKPPKSSMRLGLSGEI